MNPTSPTTEKHGQFKIHSKQACTPPCPFHAPSDHPLKDAEIHIRGDKGFLVERICEHGVGHDDPDSVAYMKAHGLLWAGVHGCDGCCTGSYPIEVVEGPMSTDSPTTSGELREAAKYTLSELFGNPQYDMDDQIALLYEFADKQLEQFKQALEEQKRGYWTEKASDGNEYRIWAIPLSALNSVYGEFSKENSDG